MPLWRNGQRTRLLIWGFGVRVPAGVPDLLFAALRVPAAVPVLLFAALRVPAAVPVLLFAALRVALFSALQASIRLGIVSFSLAIVVYYE